VKAVSSKAQVPPLLHYTALGARVAIIRPWFS